MRTQYCASRDSLTLRARKGHKMEQNAAKLPLLSLSLQSIIAILLVAGLLYGGYNYAPDGVIPVPSSDDLSVKMLYTFRCFLFPAIFMVVVIGITGLERGRVGAANPLTGNEGAMLLSKKRLINTLEQTLIFVVSTMFLTTLLAREKMTFIFLSMTVFVIGRIVFWIGYGIDPMYRTVGSMTSFLNVFCLLSMSIYHLYLHGF